MYIWNPIDQSTVLTNTITIDWYASYVIFLLSLSLSLSVVCCLLVYYILLIIINNIILLFIFCIIRYTLPYPTTTLHPTINTTLL